MKTAMISLTVVLGLLVVSTNAVPIIAKRDDDTASCPVTLNGPSGNAYFAFSTNLNIQTAREACASCYGGSLANVGVADLQFLGGNLESASWIKSWNGDDYSGSCLAIQLNADAQPGVGIDGNCASQMWPLCTASIEQAEGLQRTEEEQESEKETLITLAVPYKQNNAAPTSETVTVQDVALEPTKVDAEDNAVVTDETRPTKPAVTCPKKPDGNYETEDSCIQSEEFAAAVVIEEPTKVAAEANAVISDSSGPASLDVTCPRSVNGQVQTDGCIVHEETAAVVQEEAAAPVAPVAEDVAPAAELVVPAAAETPAPAPAAAVEAVDALTIEKEKVRAAFEEDTDSCSSLLALGEQDPLVNEYMIETLSETAVCSEARQEALAADVLARVARYEAAQAALPASSSA